MKRDVRLLPIAGCVWAAALVCVFVPAAPWWCAIAGSGGALVVGGGVVWRGDRSASRAALVLVMLAAVAAIGAAVLIATPARESAASWDGRVVEATGQVTSSASVGVDGRLWMEVQLTGVGSPGAVRSASAPGRVGVDPADGFDLGAVIRVTGEAAAADPGERAALVVFASAATVDAPASGVFSIAADLRRIFIDRARALPEPGDGLLPGLAVGDTRAVSTELTEQMKASGLSHLTAVSGANCAIVVGALFWLTALCGGGRRIRVLVAALGLSGFVILVTPEPSVIRAGVMAGAAMIAVLLGRPSAGAGMLAVSATGILLADPWLATNAGFALSVAASAALIMLAPHLTHGMRRWLPHPLALAIAVPLSAQLACGPIIALFAEQQSLVGLAANLLAAPAAPIATVIGMLACLAAPISPLADLLAACAWLPASWIAVTAEVSAAVPLAQVAMPAGILSAALVGVVSAALGIVLTGGAPTRGGRRVTALAGIVVAVVVAGVGARVLLDGPLASATTPDGWSIAACDVGQGDALLIRSHDEVALIDSGPEPEPLAECLRSLGIDRIDLLVLTHFDLDHAGGVEALQGRVDEVVHGPPGTSADEKMLARLAAGGAAVTTAAAGLRGVLGAAEWKVLWPPRAVAAFAPGNDLSVVVEFDGGAVPRSVFLGDLSAEAQRMLLRTAHIRGAFDVVKVAHHGSADQDAGLYETLRPAAALISVGEGNDYGHPRAEILAILQAVGAHVLRTDEQGRVLLAVRDGELQVWTDR